jgi:hypothetical protein
MPDVIATLTGVIETAKKLREVSKKMQDAELRSLIADLNLELADLKMQMSELREENLLLRKQVQEAKQEADFRDKVTLKDGLYYLAEAVKGRPDGPYCPRCLDAEGKLILVTLVSDVFQVFGKHSCPNCKQHY